MNPLFALRRVNLQQLVAEQGGQAAFAKSHGYSKGWLSQLVGNTPIRVLSEKVARELEEKAGLPSGHLDRPLPQPPIEQLESGSGVAELLAKNLRALMEARGVNQAELARRANVALSSVNRVFNALDNGVSPRLETIAGIARGLGVHAWQLLQAEDSAVPEGPRDPPHTVARQVSRLVEDFLISDAEGRSKVLFTAAEAAADSEHASGKRR